MIATLIATMAIMPQAALLGFDKNASTTTVDKGNVKFSWQLSLNSITGPQPLYSRFKIAAYATGKADNITTFGDSEGHADVTWTLLNVKADTKKDRTVTVVVKRISMWTVFQGAAGTIVLRNPDDTIIVQGGRNATYTATSDEVSYSAVLPKGKTTCSGIIDPPSARSLAAGSPIVSGLSGEINLAISSYSII